MATSQFIAARVSPETKSRLKMLAEQRQLSESALLKRLLELTLDGAAEPKLGDPGGARRVTRAARLCLRLRPDDQLLLAEWASARGMAAATYVSVLVRAHLRHLAPLPKDELMALKRSIAELGAIGRNLNQIAHTVRQGGSASAPRRPQPVALRIELLDVAPLVWRRVLVSNQWTLASLHHYLQWVMGWTDSHAHEFQVGASVVAADWWIHEVGLDSDIANYRDERRVSVAVMAAELGVGGEVEYRYDMGDGWQHRIGGVFDPKGFDLNRINRDWKGAKALRR